MIEVFQDEGHRTEFLYRPILTMLIWRAIGAYIEIIDHEIRIFHILSTSLLFLKDVFCNACNFRGLVLFVSDCSRLGLDYVPTCWFRQPSRFQVLPGEIGILLEETWICE